MNLIIYIGNVNEVDLKGGIKINLLMVLGKMGC